MPSPAARNPPPPPGTLVFHGFCAVKIKTIAIHPVFPRILTSDENGRIVHWDYKQSRVVSAFNVLVSVDTDYQLHRFVDFIH